ncbi:MAG: hydrogenase maturation nickel metallochaperone HypA [Devosia sp.]
MHEMSLCEGILNIIEDNARSQRFKKVTKVRVEVGRFAGVEPNALRFGFDVVMKGSVADGAALELIERPGKAFCFGCMDTVELTHRLDPCPTCGGERLVVQGGDELKIKDLEVM